MPVVLKDSKEADKSQPVSFFWFRVGVERPATKPQCNGEQRQGSGSLWQCLGPATTACNSAAHAQLGTGMARGAKHLALAVHTGITLALGYV